MAVKEVWDLVFIPEYDDFETSVVGEPDPIDYMAQTIKRFDTEKEAIKARETLNLDSLEIPYKSFLISLDIDICYRLIQEDPPKYETNRISYIPKLKQLNRNILHSKLDALKICNQNIKKLKESLNSKTSDDQILSISKSIKKIEKRQSFNELKLTKIFWEQMILESISNTQFVSQSYLESETSIEAAKDMVFKLIFDNECARFETTSLQIELAMIRRNDWKSKSIVELIEHLNQIHPELKLL